MTASAPAAPALTGLNNLRDLGGTAVEGGVIAPGLLFRSDDVSTVLPGEAEELYRRGVRTVIDLRSTEEAEHTGRGPFGDLGVSYMRYPLLGGALPHDQYLAHLRDGTATPRIVGETYAATLTAEAGTISEGITAISTSDEGILFHCAAGKDRTGVFAAALLSVLGADDDAIASDYARSAEAVPRIMERVSASIGHLLGEADAFFRAAAEGKGPVSPLLGAEYDTMREMLGIIDREHGGVVELLRGAGLQDRTVERLRTRTVLPA